MPRFILLTILSLALPACGPDMCLQADEEAAADSAGGEGLCETHPFGRAIGCGSVEPQTVEACFDLLSANHGLCSHDYVACRDAIREAACDECPVECSGIVGAC